MSQRSPVERRSSFGSTIVTLPMSDLRFCFVAASGTSFATGFPRLVITNYSRRSATRSRSARHVALNSVAGIVSDMRSIVTGHRYLVKRHLGLRPAGRERDSRRHARDGDGAPPPRCPPRQNTRFARRRTLAHKNQSKPPRSAPPRCRPTQHPSARKGFSARVLFVSSRYWPDLQTSSASAGERDQRSPFQVGILGTCYRRRPRRGL